MKAPFKLIFISLLFLTSAVCLKAQEKYDYAMVKYLPPIGSTRPGIYVSISGKEFGKIEVTKDAVKDWLNDYTPLLNYVQKMTNDGWRVTNTIEGGVTFTFVLEKKRN